MLSVGRVSRAGLINFSQKLHRSLDYATRRVALSPRDIGEVSAALLIERRVIDGRVFTSGCFPDRNAAPGLISPSTRS